MFIELDPARSDVFHGSIHDVVQVSPGEDERALVEFLNAGVPLVDLMEATVDVITGTDYITGGSSLLSDGEWVWRQDLAYYVNKYHLALDEEFIRHVRHSEYRITAPPRTQIAVLARQAARDILQMG